MTEQTCYQKFEINNRINKRTERISLIETGVKRSGSYTLTLHVFNYKCMALILKTTRVKGWLSSSSEDRWHSCKGSRFCSSTHVAAPNHPLQSQGI